MNSEALTMRLEVVQVPVADVDRAKAFYSEQLGFAVDHDSEPREGIRIVQLTPPGSACSIAIGTGLADMEPGSVKGLQLVVTDMDSVHAELTDRGVEVGEVQWLGHKDRPDSRFAHARFEDQDGNGWVLQQLPGRSV
jgi:catechol 2,3-dioxygenase-like lactoylglutathione lyase family enzyme